MIHISHLHIELVSNKRCTITSSVYQRQPACPDIDQVPAGHLADLPCTYKKNVFVGQVVKRTDRKFYCGIGHSRSAIPQRGFITGRSEERRVGKECRDRWGPDD